MQRWFEFMGNHPFLFGIMALLIVLFIMVDGKTSGKKIAPQDLGRLVNDRQARVIDIRAKNKFAEAHIAGSRHIAFTDLPKQLSALKADPTPIVFVCDMGIHAAAAAKMLAKDDPNRPVYRLEGGFANWQAQGLPTKKGAVAV